MALLPFELVEPVRQRPALLKGKRAHKKPTEALIFFNGEVLVSGQEVRKKPSIFGSSLTLYPSNGATLSVCLPGKVSHFQSLMLPSQRLPKLF